MRKCMVGRRVGAEVGVAVDVWARVRGGVGCARGSLQRGRGTGIPRLPGQSWRHSTARHVVLSHRNGRYPLGQVDGRLAGVVLHGLVGAGVQQHARQCHAAVAGGVVQRRVVERVAGLQVGALVCGAMSGPVNAASCPRRLGSEGNFSRELDSRGPL